MRHHFSESEHLIMLSIYIYIHCFVFVFCLVVFRISHVKIDHSPHIPGNVHARDL